MLHITISRNICKDFIIPMDINDMAVPVTIVMKSVKRTACNANIVFYLSEKGNVFMKKTINILFSFILVSILLLSSGCINLEYDFKDYGDGVELVKCNLNKSVVTVPAEHNGKPVVKIGYQAFAWKKLIKQIILPESVTEIDTMAFWFTTRLEDIQFGGLKRMESNLFPGCDKLTSLTLPISLETIESDCLSDLENLAEIFVSEQSETFTAVDGVLYSKDMTCLVAYPCAKSGETFDVPQAVIRIGERAFSGCENLKTIKLSDGLLRIEERAFIWCSYLENINIPKGVMIIEDDAFFGTPWLNKQPDDRYPGRLHEHYGKGYIKTSEEMSSEY